MRLTIYIRPKFYLTIFLNKLQNLRAKGLNRKKIIYTLDAFEGKDYKRIITNVNLTKGSKIKSYIYINNN